MLRVHGELRRTELPALRDQEIRALLASTMTPTQRDAYAAQWEMEYACVGPNASRFRINAFTQLHGVGAVVRCIPSQMLRWTNSVPLSFFRSWP